MIIDMKSWRKIINQDRIEGRLPITTKEVRDYIVNKILAKAAKSTIIRFCETVGRTSSINVCDDPNCNTCNFIKEIKND